MRLVNGSQLIVALAFGISSAACTGSEASPSAPPAAATPSVAPTVVSPSAEPTFAPVSLTMAMPRYGPEMSAAIAAFEALKAQGITVTLKQFDSLTQAEQAFVANQADLLFGSTEGMLNANSQGSDGMAVWEGNGDNWVLISKASVADVKELDGKPLATGPSGQTTYTLVTEGAKQLGYSPQLVVINGSGNRVQALVQGQVDSALASVADFIAQDATTPGDYQILVSYQDVFPGFSDAYFWAHKTWVDGNLAAAQAIVNALAVNYKRINTDKPWFVDLVSQYFPSTDAATAGIIWDQFTALKLWAPDAHLTPEACTSRAQFLLDAAYIESLPDLSSWCGSTMAQAAVAAAGQ
jgi:ABC-type nitrate/sulfonate/bicarbonate transport system substrate-binding protein